MIPQRSGMFVGALAVWVLGFPSYGDFNAPSLVRPEASPFGPVADLYQFPLRSTNTARGASGKGQLVIAQSPFGIAVTADGHVVYDLSLTFRGLRPAETFAEGAAYVVWITTPTLDRSQKLGVLGNEVAFRGQITEFNKFLVVVSIELSPDTQVRSGPVVLRGTSPSGLIQSFISHELFNNMPHE